MILEELQKMEKTEFDSKMFADYEDHFQYFLALGILFFYV
jgi:Ca-activated chloride channel family protein